MSAPTNSHAKWLMQAATEIRRGDHAGWGNTCEQAADEIERLEAENALVHSRMDWTVEDNAKKAIQVADLSAEIEALRKHCDNCREYRLDQLRGGL